jgi:transposase
VSPRPFEWAASALKHDQRGHFAEPGFVMAQGARNTRLLIAYLRDEANGDPSCGGSDRPSPPAAVLGVMEAQIDKLDEAMLTARRSDPISVGLPL